MLLMEEKCHTLEYAVNKIVASAVKKQGKL